MNAVAVAADKLRRIDLLWEKLQRTKTNSPEYKTLVHEIGVLAMEYRDVSDPDKKVTDSR